MRELNLLGRWVQRSLTRPRLDLPLLFALILLVGCGLAVLYSAAGEDRSLVMRQAVRLGVGFVLLMLFSRIPPMQLRVWTPWAFLLSLALLLLVPVFGVGRSARNWLNLGVIHLQPAELLKLTLPMMVAWFLHERPLPPSLRSLMVCAALIVLPTLLIAVQPDLGSALLVAASGSMVVFLAGVRWWQILAIFGLAAAAAPIAWEFMHEYQRNRIRMLLDPDADPLGNGWNIIQSKIAVGSGGFTGKGWLNSSQSRLEYLPERTTDFIFAVLSEEFGWIGVCALLCLYAFIIGRCLWIAASARETYSRLLAGALGLAMFVYVVVNAGMISGLLPVVGIPMPLMSYGGTSAVSLLASFGIVMSIHAHRKVHT